MHRRTFQLRFSVHSREVMLDDPMFYVGHLDGIDCEFLPRLMRLSIKLGTLMLIEWGASKGVALLLDSGYYRGIARTYL